MTLNKFEKEIKEKLKGREIEPSLQAWEKVSKGLDTANKPKGKHYYRYAIAAGFIGLLFILTLYFRQGQIPSGETEIVVNPAETDGTAEKDVPLVIPEKKGETSITEVSDLPKSTVENLKVESKSPGASNPAVAAIESTGPPVSVKVELTQEVIIETKLAELLQKVHVMEQYQQTVTDREVDSLLRQAQEELLAHNSGMEPSINATALLMEVEDELDESFRDQLFNTLKAGFQKVRTAVADRNN